MAELTKQALKVENNTNFPNNNTGYITPALLREFNTDMIDSTVNQAGYNTDSASWNQQIDSLEAFTGSLTTNFVSSASFNAYTASTNSSITQLNASSASQQISINELNNATASLFTSASLGLTTASFNNGTRNLTFSKGDGTTFAVNIPDVSGSAGNFVTTSSFNAYTASTDSSISQLNAASASLFTSASLGLTTASVNLNVLTFRKGDGTTFNLTVDTGSGGGGGSVPAGTISGSAQITALGFVSSSVTASSLITASISGQLITFTKGNGNAFSLTLPSSSTSLVTSSYGAFSDLTTQSGSANVAYPFKFDTVDIVDGVTLSGSTGLQVDSNGVYNIQFSAQAVQGAGAATTNIWFRKNGTDIPNSDTSITVPSNSRLVAAWNIFSTASAGDNFQIIWKSDSANTTFAFISGSGTSPNIPSIIATVNRIDIGGNAPVPAGTVSSSAQILNYGIFATTGSNTFNGNQTVNGYVSASSLAAAGALNLGSTAYLRFESGSGGSDYYNIQLIPGAGDMAFSRNGVSNTKVLVLAGSAGQRTQFQNNEVNFSSNVPQVSFDAPIALGASIISSVLITGSITTTQYANIGGALSASLPQGYVWVGDASNRTVLAATSSFTGGGGGGQTFANPSLESISGSLLVSANTFNSGAANLTHISASAQNQANLVFKNNNNTADTIVSGSNNIFVNPTAPTAGYKRYVGGAGNVYLSVLPQITGSAAGSGNRPAMGNNILGNSAAWNINQAPNPGAHTYNGNILEGGSAVFNMTGNTGVVNFNSNAGLNTTLTLNSPSRSIAEVNAGASGSNAITMQGNLLQGTITYNGPVSSSTHTVNSNAVAGTLTLNIQSGSRGLTFSNNNINGTFTATDNTVNAPTLGSSHTIQNNIVNGTVNYNSRASASFQSNSNIWNGVTLSNDWDGSGITTAAQRLLSVSSNIGFGNAINIYASGSQGAIANRRAALYNLIGGENISASLVGDGVAYSMIGTTILGNGLNVSGSSALYTALTGQNYGSAFFGRWNAENGNRAKTAETIFAVGTGTSGSTGITRKTGFLIDSGSNTFVEGTLNVSGSTAISGTFELTGSAYGNVVSMSVTSNTASMNLAAGNYFELTSSASPLRIELSNLKAGLTATLIVSASVSSSITFSSNVAQPSPGAYSGSAAASTDILSFVAFNSSKANLVATKNLI